MLYEMLKEFIHKNHSTMVDDEIMKVYNAIITLCKRNNIDVNEIKYFDEGEGSIVFECGDKIIKFAPLYRSDVNFRQYLADTDYILKPDDEEIISYKSIFSKPVFLSVMLERKLITEIATERDALNLATKLLHDGYAWIDIKARNLGLDNDGQYKLFDYGELFNKKYDNFFASHLETFSNTYTRLSNINKPKRGFFRR